MTTVAPRPEQRDPAPAAARDRAARPLAPRRPGVMAGHPGRDAALVDEDQAGGVGLGGLVAVGGALRGHVLPVLLGGPERLFLRPSLRRLSALHTIGTDTFRPVRVANAAAYSASVASLSTATSSLKAASPSASITRGRPPACGFGRRRPSPRPPPPPPTAPPSDRCPPDPPAIRSRVDREHQAAPLRRRRFRLTP